MSYVLRDYQQKASDAAVSFFNNKAKETNAIMVLPTGSGKSLIIADIAARLDGHTVKPCGYICYDKRLSAARR